MDPRSRFHAPAIVSPVFVAVLGITALSLGGAAAADWNLPRGNANATGASEVTLPDTLEVAWEFKADEAIETTPVISGDRLFVADLEKVYAVSREDGSELWRSNIDTIGFIASPVVADGRVIIGDIDGKVFALGADDGKLQWTAETEGEIYGEANLYQDKVLVASQDGKLYCLEADSGKAVWTYEADDQIRCAPTIAGNYTFLGGCDSRLHIVDLTTGKAVGETLPLSGPTGSTPAIAGELAILPVMDGAVFAFDWKKREQVWQYEDLDQAQEYRNSAAVSGNLAIVSSERRHIDALDIRSGERKWRYTLKRFAKGSPVIAGDDVWIAATDGRLVRLGLKDGVEKWVYEVRGSYVGGPAVTDKELFVADDDGILRCFR